MVEQARGDGKGGGGCAVDESNFFPCAPRQSKMGSQSDCHQVGGPVKFRVGGHLGGIALVLAETATGTASGGHRMGEVPFHWACSGGCGGWLSWLHAVGRLPTRTRTGRRPLPACLPACPA
jgi:hypothetical protein